MKTISLRALRPWAGLLVTLVLAGCAGFGSGPSASATGSPAVAAMLATAGQDRAAGHLDRAAANLERALRIEARNPVIWHQLAQVRLQQGRYDLVTGLAAKSNTLAGRDDALRAANWRLIGTARSALGDSAGANAAFATATRLEGR